MGRIRRLLLLLGLVLLGVLLARIDLSPVFDQVRSLSWGLLILLFPCGLTTILDTVGWRYAFRGALLPLSILLPVRLAGKAFNTTSLTATLGGEPVKIYLLHPQVSVEEGAASVVIDKTTALLAQICVLLLGIVFSPLVLPVGSPFVFGMVGLAILGALAIAGFVMAQRHGLFGRSLRILNRLGFRWHGGLETAQGLDEAIATFYTIHRPRLALSYLFHLMGSLVGIVEVYLILWLLGFPISLTTAIVIEAFSSAIKAVGFLIPGAIGVEEGGNMAIFMALGLTAGGGLSFSVVRRIRELVVVVVGLTALAVVRRGRPIPHPG
ncbi:membrane protein [Candidatus Methylomirabilis lanthanidiphila]|uniref:Membrane protein n=1 Tax=Candidatus Methylomirabilis lanthanidiphila TaxID=2211376 RepID=A0A564ZJ83_9BACT|nr:membrane protein [Candidatus Methylomirabilis lanthanidiphila]